MSGSKPSKASTRSMYIGTPRCDMLCKHAREISVLAEANIKPSAFLQFLIDTFSDQARAALLMQLRNEQQKK